MNLGAGRQKGFTMPELLVVGGLLLAAAVMALTLIRPNTYDAQKRNAQRRLDLVAVLGSLQNYRQDNNGQLPVMITHEEYAIESSTEDNGLCEVLAPDYLANLPLDPLVGVSVYEDSCVNELDQVYLSGYTVQQTDGGRIWLRAPYAEAGETIEIKG